MSAKFKLILGNEYGLAGPYGRPPGRPRSDAYIAMYGTGRRSTPGDQVDIFGTMLGMVLPAEENPDVPEEGFAITAEEARRFFKIDISRNGEPVRSIITKIDFFGEGNLVLQKFTQLDDLDFSFPVPDLGWKDGVPQPAGGTAEAQQISFDVQINPELSERMISNTITMDYIFTGQNFIRRDAVGGVKIKTVGKDEVAPVV